MTSRTLGCAFLLISPLLMGADTKSSRPTSTDKLETLPLPPFELPKLDLMGPKSPDKYWDRAGFSISVQVTPPIATRARVRVDHVRDDGGLVSQFNLELQLDEQGKSAIHIGAPASRWKSGRTRVLVYLAELPQVRSQTEFDVVSDPNQPPGEFVLYEAPLSDTVIDLDKPESLTQSVTAGCRFRVRGMFYCADKNTTGSRPRVFNKLVRPGVVGGAPDVIFDSGTTISFAVSHPGHRDHRWFELFLEAPKQVGTYKLSLKPLGLSPDDERRNMGRFLSDIELNITPP